MWLRAWQKLSYTSDGESRRRAAAIWLAGEVPVSASSREAARCLRLWYRHRLPGLQLGMTVYHPLVPGEEIGSDGRAAHFIAARTITGFEICFNRCSGWPAETARIGLVCQLRKTQQQLYKYIFAHDVFFTEEGLLRALPNQFCTCLCTAYFGENDFKHRSLFLCRQKQFISIWQRNKSQIRQTFK